MATTKENFLSLPQSFIFIYKGRAYHVLPAKVQLVEPLQLVYRMKDELFQEKLQGYIHSINDKGFVVCENVMQHEVRVPINFSDIEIGL